REYEDTVIVGGYAASGGYHYSFQNQEKHDEIRGKGKYINYKYRGYDPRVGRLDWMVDPLAAKYPYYSPYAFSGNRVLDAMELEGLEPLHNKSGKIDKQHYKVAGVINVRDGQKVYVYQLLNSPTFVISKEGADKLVGAGYTYSKNPQKYVTTEFNDDETNLRLVTYIDGVSPTTSEDLKEFGTVFSTATITGNNHLLNQIQNENLIAMETLPITNPIKPEAGSPNNNDVKIGDRVVPPGGDLWVNINAQFDANTTNINNLSEINGAITNIANALNANPSNTITIFGSANLPPSTDWNTINTRAGISFGQLADQRNQTIANLLIRQGVNPSQINMQRGRTDAMRVNGNFRNAAPSTD
ncbi:MAG: hypothetical protein H3C31_13940, partial [Brumimicrobium sp.]|nr:hypothetical protein [Brumimicrobium sp.]